MSYGYKTPPAPLVEPKVLTDVFARHWSHKPTHRQTNLLHDNADVDQNDSVLALDHVQQRARPNFAFAHLKFH